MLKKLKDLFDFESSHDTDVSEENIHLAAAILFFEIAKSDHQLEETEINQLEKILRDNWSLNDNTLNDLLDTAMRESDLSASLHEQIEIINKNFNQEKKYKLVFDLWKIAWSDGEIHHYEEHLIRRISDLLYIPHSEFIKAKHKAHNPD
tara:strand:- start:18709 stop:19155 length:447 start_codon:yes stop_codon:yes gene_type:complete